MTQTLSVNGPKALHPRTAVLLALLNFGKKNEWHSPSTEQRVQKLKDNPPASHPHTYPNEIYRSALSGPVSLVDPTGGGGGQGT